MKILVLGKNGQVGWELQRALAPNKPQGVERYRDLITYVKDRPGHDVRYRRQQTDL